MQSKGVAQPFSVLFLVVDRSLISSIGRIHYHRNNPFFSFHDSPQRCSLRGGVVEWSADIQDWSVFSIAMLFLRVCVSHVYRVYPCHVPCAKEFVSTVYSQRFPRLWHLLPGLLRFRARWVTSMGAMFQFLPWKRLSFSGK